MWKRGLVAGLLILLTRAVGWGTPPTAPLAQEVWHVGDTVVVRWGAPYGAVKAGEATWTALDASTGAERWTLRAPVYEGVHEVWPGLMVRGGHWLINECGRGEGWCVDPRTGAIGWRAWTWYSAGEQLALDRTGHGYEIGTGTDLGKVSPFADGSGALDREGKTALFTDISSGGAAVRDAVLVDVGTHGVLGRMAVPAGMRALAQRGTRSYVAKERQLWVLDVAAGKVLEKTETWSVGRYDDARDVIAAGNEFILAESGLHREWPADCTMGIWCWTRPGGREALVRDSTKGMVLWDVEGGRVTRLPEVEGTVRAAERRGDVLAVVTFAEKGSVECWEVGARRMRWRKAFGDYHDEPRVWMEDDRVGMVDARGRVCMMDVATGAVVAEERIGNLPTTRPMMWNIPPMPVPWWKRWWVWSASGVAALMAGLLRRPLGRWGGALAAASLRPVNWLLAARERPMVVSAPPPENAGALSPEGLTLAYLERNEAPCPACGYNVHRLTEARCPECGRKLVLRLVTAEGMSRAWVALVCLTAIGSAPGVMILLMDDEYGHLSQLPGRWQFALWYFALSLPLLVLVVWLRKRLMRGRGWVRGGLMAAYGAGLAAAFSVMIMQMAR